LRIRLHLSDLSRNFFRHGFDVAGNFDTKNLDDSGSTFECDVVIFVAFVA
jgi:hypothetical protein